MSFFDDVVSFGKSVVNSAVGTVKAVVKNPVMALAAVGLAVYAPALGLRILSSMMISSVLNAATSKDTGGGNPDGSTTAQAGTTQPIPAKTTNKLPAVYGKAFVPPTMIDAKISTDNQTMWYVMAICEAPTAGTAQISFGDVIWDGSVATFGSGGRVTKLTNAAGQEDTKIDGNLWIYFYNGSGTPINGTTQTAYQVLQDSTIPSAARWVGTEKMTSTIFVIIKLVYSTDDDVRGLPSNLQIETNIYQNGITDGYKPGSAMLDYLTNDRFGAGLNSSDVNAQSFYDLDTYADEVITFTPTSGGTATQPRYRMNGIVDTARSIMSNWGAMAECCDAFIQYNESMGKWSVVTNKGYDQLPNSQLLSELFILDPNNIIGGINITPLDLNSTPNSVESNFPSYKLKGQIDSVYAETPQRLQNMFEPPQRLTTTYQFIHDYVRAQYLSNRKLEQCRADYIVDLTADYSAITIDAGDVVLLTYEPFGGSGLSWTNKPFRVTQIQEQRTDDGSLICKLQLVEYSSQVYDNFTIQDYNPPQGNYVLDPSLLGKPATPTIPDATILPTDTVPSFVVAAKTPASGVTVALEFWYGPTDAITDNNYKLYETQYNSSKAQYGVSIDETVKVTGLPEGTWYWRVRAIGAMRKSDFSDSVEIVWAPVLDSNVGGNGGNADTSTMILVPWTNNSDNWPNNTRGIMPAGGVSMIAAANPGSIRVNFSSTIYSALNSEYNCVEVWKTVASKVYSKKVYSLRHSYDSTTAGGHSQRLQAVGTNMDYISDDGGVTWTQYDSASTTKTLTGALSFFIDGTWNYQTHAVGLYQDADGASTDFVNSAYRFDNAGTETPPVKLSLITTPGGTAGNKIYASFNEIAKVGNTGGSRSYQQSSMIVGDNGGLWFNRNTGLNAWPVQFGVTNWNKETTGVLQNLYSVYANDYNGTDYTAIAVGAFGTIIKSDRSGMTTGTWSSKVTEYTDGSPVTKAFNAVAGDDTAKSSSSKWVAVGETGTLFSSLDNGDSWTQRELLDGANAITNSLRDVKYGNGKWVVVGDAGMILTSTDTITWTILTAPTGYTDRNLYSVDYSATHSAFNIGGDALILRSGDSTLSFTKVLDLFADEVYTMDRLYYRGSNANAQAYGTAVSTLDRINNGTITSTIIDTKYKKGDELGYYLVIGNIKGGIAPQEVRVAGSVITATEYKK